MFLKGVAVWCLLMVLETIHGIARVRFLNRRVGDRRARQIGVVTGSLLIFLVSLLTMRWIDPSGSPELFALGLLWVILTVLFEIVLGRWVFRMPWKRVWADFNPWQGGWMAFALAVMALIPWIAAKVLRLI